MLESDDVGVVELAHQVDLLHDAGFLSCLA